MDKNIIAIIGKSNVGKSTLFNRIAGARKSIVYDQDGVTRDRLYYSCHWLGKKFRLIDTGGIQLSKGDFLEDIKIQAQIAIEEATVIILVLDGRVEITPEDYHVVDLIRKSHKQIIIAANKIEGTHQFDVSIYNLGIEEIFPISALHGEGVGSLLEGCFNHFIDDKKENKEAIKISIIGKPNVGKSSLLNCLINENRSIVSEIPGTTRDSVSSLFKIEGEAFEIIDTAGIIRKSKLLETLDHLAWGRARTTLDESDLSILVIDATNELAHFDARIAGYAMEKNKSFIIVINKWDLIDKNTNTMSEFEKKVRKNFKFAPWVQIVFLSAKNNQRIQKLRDSIMLSCNNSRRKIKTSLLNEVIMEIQQIQPAPSLKGRRFNVQYAKQIEAKIPTFVFFVNDVKYLHFSYERYLENQIRDHFDFSGTAIKFLFRNKNKK